MNHRIGWLLVFGLGYLLGCGDDETPAGDAGLDIADTVSDAADVVEDTLPDPQADPEVVEDTTDVEDEMGVVVGDCSPDSVLRFQSGSDPFIAVYPHDWSVEVGNTYRWYDNTELYEWIVSGVGTSIDYAEALAEVEFVVVGTDGMPNIAPNPPTIPYIFSRYYYSPTLDTATQLATKLYGWADRDETLEPDDIADELVDEEGNGLTEDDREIYEQLMPRWNRWTAAMDGLRQVVDDHFGYDSDNLQCAFDQAQIGESIQLMHGDGEIYVLNEAIMVEGFTGELFGQGAGATVIKTAPGGFVSPPGPHFDVRATVLLFVGGDFVLRDFDLVTEGTAQMMSHYVLLDSFIGIFITGPHDGEHNFGAGDANAEVRNIRFLGDAGDKYYLGTNMVASLIITGEQLIERDRFNGNLLTGEFDPLEGEFLVDGCHSVNSLNGLVSLWGLNDATAVVSNSTGTGTDALISIDDCSGGTYRIVNNETEGAGGLSFVEGSSGAFGSDLGPTGVFPEEPCEVTVEDNIFRNAESWWAPIELHSWVFLADPPGTSSQITIEGNTIESVNHFPGEGFAFEGVFADGLDNGIITENTFVGTGFAAVYVGLFETEDTGWTIEDNSFAGYTTYLADIYLGPNTTGNTVVGITGETTTLMDDGTGNTASNVTLVE